MSSNRICIAASASRIFETLSDPFLYDDWVVGTSDVIGADGSWPKAGSSFNYQAGLGPARWEGTTEVLECDPPRLLSLQTTLPVGPVRIDIEVREVDHSSEVTLTEWAVVPLLKQSLDPALHLRNAQSLAHLKALVEEHPPAHLDQLAGLAPGRHWLSEPVFADVVDAAEISYVAIDAAQGPHVTPTAFAVSAGRIWMLVDRSSVKAKVLTKRPEAGVVFTAGTRSVVIDGTATLVDPWRAWMPQNIAGTSQAAPALVRYLVENRSRLGGYLDASLEAIASLNPLTRLLISMSPRSVLLVEDGRVVERRGTTGDLHVLRGQPSVGEKTGAPLPLDDAPGAVAELGEEERVAAVLAWDSDAGPLALPAHWHGERRLVSVPSALLRGVTEGRAAVCLMDDEGDSLDDKEGVLVRGQGRVVGVRGDYAAITIEPDRTVAWSGRETSTTTPESSL